MEELNQIVQSMVDAGETESNIQLVIESYKPQEEAGKTNDSANADPMAESKIDDGDSKSVEPLSAWQSIKNSFSNLGEQLYDVKEFWLDDDGANASLDIASNAVASMIFGQENVDKFVEEQGEGTFLTEGLGSKGTIEDLKAYAEEKGKSKQTLGIIEGAKKGDIGAMIAGGVNAFTSLLGSVGFGAGTLGTGFFMDYAAENYIEFNKLKAENLGVDLKELIKSGEADTAIPVGMAAVAQGLEMVGLGTIFRGVKGAVKGKGGAGLVGMGSKYLAEKLIYNKGARAAVKTLATGSKEFTTEILQHAAEEVNKEFGSVAGTDNEAEIGKAFIDAVTSQEGLEAGIQGFIGGSGLVGGTYSAKAMGTIRTAVDGDLIEKNIDELSVLRSNKKSTEDATVAEGIQKEIDIKESEIADSVVKGNEIYESLDEGQIKEIETLSDLADVSAYKITELNKKLRRGDITEAEYELGKTGFEADYNKAKQGIIDMDLEKNLKFAKETSEAKGLGYTEFETTAEMESAINKSKGTAESKQNYQDNKNTVAGAVVNGELFINKEVAKKTGSINVGSHEVLHPILNALVGDATQQSKIVKDFRKSMTSAQRKTVDKQMKDRGYNTPGLFATEYINVFSDALAKGQINYDKNTFEKIGDAIVGIFKPKGFDNISFDSGKDVYNFVKEYSKSSKEGKLTSKVSEALGDVDLKKEGGLKVGEMQFSKTLTPEQSASLSKQVVEIKRLSKENAEIAAKYNKEPIKGTKQTRLENQVREGIKPLVEKIVSNRTKALYDPIAPDAKKAVTRQEFQDSMRSDIEAMVLNEYDETKQDLEKFTVSRAYLRANDLAKRLGIESQEEGGIKKDVDAAKDIVSTKDTQSVDRSGSVERGQATFDELDIVDDKLISEIESEVSKELKMRASKGTLSEMVSVKRGRETYFVSWLENLVDKTLFKKILKKWGAIGETKGVTVIPPGYIDFLNSKEVFNVVTKALPIKTIKKSYGKLFKIEKVGREKSAQGNPIFRIAPTDKKTFLQYFLDGKKTTILERQKQLAREIITPVTKEIVANYATPENLLNLKEIKELAPEKSIDVVEKISIEAQVNKLQSELDRYKGENTGFDIIQFSKNLEEYNISKKDTTKFFNMLIEGGIYSKSAKEFLLNKGVSEKNYESIAGDLISEGIIAQMQEIKAANKGIKYEKALNNVLGKYTEAGLKVDLISRKKGDIKVSFGKNNYKIEVKLNDKAQIGSASAGPFVKKDGKITLRDNLKLSKKISDSNFNKFIDFINSEETQKYLKDLVKAINKANSKSDDKATISRSGHIKLPNPEFWDNIKNEMPKKQGGYVSYEGNQSIVEDFYKGIDLIQIGDQGAYSIGNDSKLSAFYEKLSAVVDNVYRPVRTGTTVYMRLFPNFKEIKNNKQDSLDTKQGISKLAETTGLIIQYSKSRSEIDENFNNIIEKATGIESAKTMSGARSKVLGQNKGKFKFFIPPSADDFAGLVSRLLGKGKEGDANAAWFKENLFDPFAKGIRDYESYKEQSIAIVRALKKSIRNIPNGLKKVNDTGFTNEQAVRVYMWVKNGYDIKDLSEADQKELVKVIEDNKALKDFADELDESFGGYPEPDNEWLGGSIVTDMLNMVNTSKRAEFLQSWQENSDIIFSKENLNKLRAAYGDNYVEALEDMLYRMKTGRNRPSGSNKLTNTFMNWVNDSVGTIMFFNTRSALLQTLSIANFINWKENNPAKAAMAFANQKQFWSDFAMLFNSDFLKQRRGGLKNDVNADELASAAETATNKPKAVLSSILKAGFLPTQMADSFAIAMGGASFIRNRINKYVSEGMDVKAAEEQSFLDFQEIAEETQQSSRPDRVSQQQASPLGRIVLAFANTPMQYMRLTKKAYLDLKNGRGDAKTNISKIVYYTVLQNVIFGALQSALFASLFEDEEDEELKNKEIRIANSMLDSILRGLGIYGAIASTGKNIILEAKKQADKPRPDFTQAAIKSLDLSPPLSSKLRKLISTSRAFTYKNVRDKMTKSYGLENPAYYAIAQSVSAVTNVPIDRAIKKADNIRVAMDNDTKLWQSIALSLGYSQWDLGLMETGKSKKDKRKVLKRRKLIRKKLKRQIKK